MNGLNQDDIIRMAREVADIQTDSRGREEFIFDSYGIEAFANLVAAVEREECVKVVQEWLHGEWHNQGVVAALMIRERGAP